MPPFPLVTKEAGLAALGVEAIKFYPGQEQVDLSVEIEVPGSWFNGTAIGSLTTTERRQKYKAQTVAAVREFPAATRGGKKNKESGIRFLCIEDAADDPHSVGYWMKLTQWNRYRRNPRPSERATPTPPHCHARVRAHAKRPLLQALHTTLSNLPSHYVSALRGARAPLSAQPLTLSHSVSLCLTLSHSFSLCLAAPLSPLPFRLSLSAVPHDNGFASCRRDPLKLAILYVCLCGCGCGGGRFMPRGWG